MSDANSLPDQIERIPHALTAAELAELLAVSPILIYKLAKANRLPCFKIGTCSIRSASCGKMVAPRLKASTLWSH